MPNITPRSFVRLYELAVVQRDYAAARELYFSMLPLLTYMESGRYTQLVKAGCKLNGYDVGDPRAPLCAVSEEALAMLRDCLGDLT